MTLHLITITLGFNGYKWIDNPIDVIEKEHTYVLTSENDEYLARLVPELIPKSKVNVVLAAKHTGYRQISLSIYTTGHTITEAKDKLILEIRGLSEAYRKGFEEQAKILETITHENQR